MTERLLIVDPSTIRRLVKICEAYLELLFETRPRVVVPEGVFPGNDPLKPNALTEMTFKAWFNCNRRLAAG